jgi:hypothetical protein
MRYFTVALVLFLGCASTAHVSATGAAGRPVFQISSWWRPVKVLGIIVYENADQRPLRSVCRLKRVAPPEADFLVEINRWEYGASVNSNYQAQNCEPLQIGREYSIAVPHVGLCGAGTRFRLQSDGTVQDLGPHWSGCDM